MKGKHPRCNGPQLFLLVCALVSLYWAGLAHGGEFTAWGPQGFQRSTGTPVPVVFFFPISNPSTSYTLKIYNGGLPGLQTGERVSSAVILLNDAVIVGPHDFNQKVSKIELPVKLLASNKLSVELRSKAGSLIIVEIVGIAVDNNMPVASAGQDQDVTIGSLVTLDGRSSYDPDGDLITYKWAIVMHPSGSSAGFNDPTSVIPTFTPDMPGEYRMSLIVNDGQADSAPDEVVIIATPPNVAPTAYAGPDQSVVTGSWVNLDGRGSFDPDGDPLTYRWQMFSSPEGSTASLDDSSSPAPTFLADRVGQYTILLTVNDGELDSLPDDVIVVSAIPSAPPVSYAGVDQTVSKNSTIQLDGRASSDPNNDALTYTWGIVSKPAGSAGELDDPASPTPKILADQVGDYVVRLVVFDGQLYSEPDNVVITVVNDPPIADAGPDQDGVVGVMTALYGGGSSDPNGDSLTYQWTIFSAPSGSTAAIVNPTSMTLTITPDRPGVYVIQLVVNDGSTDSSPDTATLTVRVAVPNVVGQPQASAEAAIIAAGLTDGAITQVNSDVVPVGQVISQSPVEGTLALAGSLVSLTVSLGPAPVLVPDVTGILQSAAEAAIQGAKLVVGAVTTTNSPTVPAGSVISQNPVGGASVPVGSSVSLVVSLGPALVTVPNVVGMTQADAQAALVSAGLTIGTIITANSDTVTAGNVISQNPTASNSVPAGSSVNILVSIGPVTVTVPNVVGMAQGEAQSAIIAAGLTVGTVTSDYHDTIPAGSVINQNPAGGSSVAEGSSVSLVISLGPSGPPPVNGVLLEGPPDATAVSALRNVDFISGIPEGERSTDAIGRRVARTELLLTLAPSVKVADVNSVLTRFGARIIWMTTNVPYLLVRVPDPGTLGRLDALVSELQATSVFEEVSRAYFPETSALPGDFDPTTLLFFESIDHLLGINAPAAWNAREALKGRQLPTFLIADYFGAGAPIDSPFAISPELNDYSNTTYNVGRNTGHGYHVLGIAAADFDGDEVTGLLPSLPGAPLPVRAIDESVGLTWYDTYAKLTDVLFTLTNPPLNRRVIVNTSLGYHCWIAGNGVACPESEIRAEAVKWVRMVRDRGLEDKFLHMTSAGNIEGTDTDEARTGSPFAAAALLPLSVPRLPNLTNIIVVENVVGRANPPYTPQCLNRWSKVGGHVSAVGTEVESYVRPVAIPMPSWTGTSMAAPQVAGLAAYVWALDPTLSPEQVKNKIMNTTREVTLPAIRPVNCSNKQAAPVINAYAAVLAVDEPVALTAAGTPADAPARFAILDVADSNGVESSDGKFDEGDLRVFLDKIPPGVGPARSHRSGYDWSRYDLNGNGHTGACRGNRFNLDINKPAAWTYVTAPEDPGMTFNENCVTDLQFLCYYAYSRLYTGNDKLKRDNVLRGFCGHGQKAWRRLPIDMTGESKLAADGRGNVFAASYDGLGITITRVAPGDASLVATWPVAEPYPTPLLDLAVDRAGSMVVIYSGEVQRDLIGVRAPVLARRYNVGTGWQEPIVIDTQGVTNSFAKGGEQQAIFSTAVATDAAGHAVVVWVKRILTFTQVEPIGFVVHFAIKAVRYDVDAGWEMPTVLTTEDPDIEGCPYCDFNRFPPTVNVATNTTGDAIVVWSGFDAPNRKRVLRANRYRVGNGWDIDSRLLTAPNHLYAFAFNIVMDALGNAIVTSYSPHVGTRVNYFDVNSGWQAPFIVVDNYSPLWPAYAEEPDSPGDLSWPPANFPYQNSLTAMDACGNAMLVYEQFHTDDYSSLMSKRYYVDTGWEDTATVIEPIFNLGTAVLPTFRLVSKALLAFAMDGGGNATLITGERAGARTYAHTRQYHAGKGWNDWVSSADGGTIYKRPIIDGYGNGTYDSSESVMRFD